MFEKRQKSTSAIIALSFLILCLVVNMLGILGIINHTTQTEVSDLYHTLVTPAGFTFLIWTLVYTGLVIANYLMTRKDVFVWDADTSHAMLSLFCASCVLNALWIISYAYKAMWASVLLILALAIVTTLLVGHFERYDGKFSALFRAIFGLYAGWVFIASVPNVANFLVSIGFRGAVLPESVWASITLAAAFALLYFVGRKLRNPFYYLPTAWAMAGIMRELQIREHFTFDHLLMIVCLLIAIGAIALFALEWFRKPKPVEMV